VVYVSSKQLPHNPKHTYIACRLQAEGNFDTPLYAGILKRQFLPTEDGEFNGNEQEEPCLVSSPLLKKMSALLEDLSPEDTIGFSNGVRWVDVATVEEIRSAAYPSFKTRETVE